jgi:hypothetical protein
MIHAAQRSEDEIALAHGDGIIETNGEIRCLVTVDVSIDIAVGGLRDVAQLSRLPVEGGRADKGEGIVLGRLADRVDVGKIDPVGLAG